ncbi:MAG: CsbD family protein, partial [Pseudonocardiaceae bacterium]
MSSFEKAKDKAEQLIGKAEKKVGEMLGHEDLENAGERDQLAGEVEEAGHDLRDDSATGAADDAGAVHDAGAADDAGAVHDAGAA